MIMLKDSLLFLLFLGISLPFGQAQKGMTAAVKKNIQLRIDNGMNVGIVVGLIDADGTQYYSFGTKSLATKEKVDEHSVFEIGSISKTFTGILLADQVVKGKVKLDDPVQKYLPEGVTSPTRNGEAIQLVHLSNHTSALPRMPSNFNPANPANPFADYSEKAMYEFLTGYALSRDIGSQYEYSNYAVGLLGHILAQQQKMTYEELVLKTITTPLDMKDTRVTLTPKMEKNLALGHSGAQQVENWDIPTLGGAGAIRSTAVDMLKYLAANMGMQKSDLYPAMQLSHKNTRKDASQPVVGLGWHTTDVSGTAVIWHNGGTGGYRTFTGFVKGGKKGVVVLANSTASVDDIGLHLLNPSSPLQTVKPSIAKKLQTVIDSKGIQKGIETYHQLKKAQADKYEFAETELNNLGYYYLNANEIDKAIAVLKLNTEAYPKAFNVYDSMGEAYQKKGDKEKAIANYKKSVEINPANENGIQQLKALGANMADIIADVEIADDILESYVGQYELMPNFILTISKDGKQMKAQATGQPQFPIFARAENVFYFKVVPAQLTFNTNAASKVESVTLLQGGQEIVGKKLAK